MLQVPNFDAINSVTVGEALWVLVVCVGHHGDALSAVKMFMVIMTFDRVLWGMP